jgi:hypothetical protein
MVWAVRTTGCPPCQCSGEFIDPRLRKTRTTFAVPVDKRTSAMTKGEYLAAAITTVPPVWSRAGNSA